MRTNKTLSIICSILALLGLSESAFAQSSNDFFGSSVVPPGGAGGSTPIERPPGVAAAEQQALKQQAGTTDLTSDEKRMQKKYKAKTKYAAEQLAKAEKMIQEGTRKKDEKVLKKGQVLKLIYEKQIKELKENNPLQEK